MDAFEVLVIILSVMLAILLLITGVLFVLLIKILKKVRHITDKADDLISKVESAGEFFQKAAGPLVLGRLIKGFVKGLKRRKS